MTLKAAIDLGTNTAHIIIAQVEGNKIIEIVYRKRFYVYLAEEGIENIGQKAQKRLYNALNHFQSKTEEFKCSIVNIVATEALRKADNGEKIMEKIYQTHSWTPQIITGETEATYIYNGVSSAMDLKQGNYLIVDIGGGSVEFIYVENDTIKDLRSLPIGIANLYNQFHLHEPISQQDVDNLNNHLHSELHFLTTLGSRIELIGSAGTFEIFSTQDPNKVNRSIDHISNNKVKSLLAKVIDLNIIKRETLNDIPKERAKYIVVALLLINLITDKLGVDEFWVSRYALKEGVLISFS